jgi:hypothetical protein
MIKDTETLYHEIQSAPDINAYLTDNRDSLLTLTFSEYLHELLADKGLTVAEVQRRGHLTNYVYEVFRGDKVPNRDAALQICFGLSLTPDEAQRLLRMAKAGTLYPKDRRDSILLFGLKEGLDCVAVNALLAEKGLASL